jgi:hypothetical protein
MQLFRLYLPSSAEQIKPTEWLVEFKYKDAMLKAQSQVK